MFVVVSLFWLPELFQAQFRLRLRLVTSLRLRLRLVTSQGSPYPCRTSSVFQHASFGMRKCIRRAGFYVDSVCIRRAACIRAARRCPTIS